MCVERRDSDDNVGQHHTGENSSEAKEQKTSINDDDDDLRKKNVSRLSLKMVR